MTKNDNTLLNRVFSRNTLKALLNESEKDNAYYAVLRRYINEPYNKNHKTLISEIYHNLKDKYRNEYYYKNTLLNRLLFKEHNPLNTVALTEIPVGKSIADFIMINGKAIVYEIKTELDNFERLDSQLENYYKAFDNVCVVTSENNLDAIQSKLNKINIGIYYISKRGALKKHRKPISDMSNLDYEIIFKILRKKEYETIISKYYDLPQVTQFKYYQACKDLFFTIPLANMYNDFKEQLKTRSNIDIELISDVPKEIKSVVYFSRLKQKEYDKLNLFLNKEYGG